MKNSTISKQSIGIDVSADSLQVRVGRKSTREQRQYPAGGCFANTPRGFRKLHEWVSQRTADSAEAWFIMEATGVYYEGIAYFLHERGANVCVLVPTRAKHYAKSLPVKSKTDAIDARILARYGLERCPRRWQPASRRLRQIKLLLRERDQLKDQYSRLKSRQHAARHRWHYPQSSRERLQQRLDRIKEDLQAISQEVDELWKTDQPLCEAIERISGIKGVSEHTVLQVVAETHGFALITNRNQLASYSGLDVVLDESGHRQGATKISKQGNGHIRRSLYMPALSAIQYNPALKAFYQRLIANHPDHKKIAVTAVMRKLLLLIYSLWKSGQTYNPQFHYQQITATG